MNKSVMKCCICNNENIGRFITINNKKYHLCCIEQLQQENQKYKEVIDKAIDLIEKSVTTDIGIDSNNNIIHYHQLTEDETGELLDILKEVE